MPLTLGIVIFAAAAAAFPTDTTVAVGPRTRLQLRNLIGDIEVRTWDRSAVRVRAAHSPREHVVVEWRGPVLVVDARPRSGEPGEVAFQILVPRAMPVNLEGVHTSARVQDLTGGVCIQTITGEIAVQGGVGNALLSSIQGAISVNGTHGRLKVDSVDGEVRLSEIDASIQVETVNGPIVLRRVVSDSVEASSVSGNLCYDGTIAEGGRYRFRSHNGDIAVGLPEASGATVTLATYRGEIDSDFPLRVSGKGERNRFLLRLGDGRAHLDLESFNGAIRLRRPAADGGRGGPPCPAPEPHAGHRDKEKEGKR